MGDFIFNGKFYKEGTAIAGAANRGLRYGDGVFETMKIKKGKLVLEDAHFARLWKGMATLCFDIPKHFTPEKLSAIILQLAIKNGHEKNARVRLQIFRGDGGLYDAVNHSPNYVIETWMLAGDSSTLNSNGLELGIYADAKKSCDILSNLKHSNFLPYVLASHYAKKQKWNDALLLNQHQRICDSTIANVFIIKNEIVFTPALNEGCVAGIMREHIIATLKATAFNVNETSIAVEDILNADEVFLTNSIYDMRWVKSIGNTAYSNSTTQKIYSLILQTIV
jgi:branched-chain amino acid aminotransferase